MRPCFFYTFLSDKILNLRNCPCKYKRFEGKPKIYYACQFCSDCQKDCNLKDEHNYRRANTVVNVHKDNNMELITYNESFVVPIRSNQKNLERKRLLIKYKDGYRFNSDVLNPWERLENNRFRSAQRAKDLVYSYIRNNKWKYFVTLTYSPYSINRIDDEVVKYEYKKFRQQLQYYDKNVLMLCIPEQHESGELHFHILIGTDVDIPIVACVESKPTWNQFGFYNKLPETTFSRFMFPIFDCGEFKKGRFGNVMFALSFFNKGRNFTSVIDNSHKHAAFNYVAKYVNKSMTVGYGKKRIYATSNLDKKSKLTVLNDSDDDIEIILDNNLQLYKVTSKSTIYRNYNVTGQINKLTDGEENGNKVQ